MIRHEKSIILEMGMNMYENGMIPKIDTIRHENSITLKIGKIKYEISIYGKHAQLGMVMGTGWYD